ncbi:sensor histidine kinase [Streptomyces sp. NPDC018584]|uniref:sensor histidine kinase n=1 Tax=unclassified Streptomyces TaxID=2593676 RepID=UPI0037ADE9AB
MRSRRSCRRATSSCRTWAEVSVRRRPARRLHCRLEVSNSGTGVPPESVSRLLAPFQRRQARSHSHQTGEGVGLGLATVTSIAHAYAATMHVRANADGGLTVEVDFPPIDRYGRQSAQDLQRPRHRAPNGSCLCHAVANRQAPPTRSNRQSSSCPTAVVTKLQPGPGRQPVSSTSRDARRTPHRDHALELAVPAPRRPRCSSRTSEVGDRTKTLSRYGRNPIPCHPRAFMVVTRSTRLRYPDTASIDAVCGW